MKTVLLAMVALATPALAQTPASRSVQPVTITMTDHGFVPRNIALRRGGSYVLHIANRSDKGHNLTQKAFFAAARLSREDRGLVRDGQIVLAAGERATIRFQAPLTRRGGMFQFSSTTLGDADNAYTGAFRIQ
ncbi:cupredoxin domain-containing protein [Sphingomonas sp. PWP1-2]|uniref:cupredoxin domain-containing protein n=1 Tax=Sphingomonas sp. PWP1-2 TaxID=2804558 RepID=UPI003CEA0E71